MIEIKKEKFTSNPKLIAGIIGIGEVGIALWSILDEEYETIPIDPANGYEAPEECKVDHLHITIPYNELFIEEVITWIVITEPIHVIIHSTIIPETCNKLQEYLLPRNIDVIISYSPCHCWSPHIKEHLLIMSKNLATDDKDNAKAIAGSLESAGFNISLFNSNLTLEWAHIQFIWRCALEQMWTNNVHEISKEKDLDFLQMAPAYTEIMNMGMSHSRNLSRFFPILSYNNTIPCDKHSAKAATLSMKELPDSLFKEIISKTLIEFQEES